MPDYGKRAVKQRVRQVVPIDISDMDPDMQKVMQEERGRIIKAKAVYAPTSLETPAKNPKTTPARALQASQTVSESYDDMIAKARGQRAYYEGSKSRTKAALAARMAGR